MVIGGGGAERICHVTNEAYFLEPRSDTFHGRDVFAPVAAHLSKGVSISELGQEIATDKVRKVAIPTPSVSEEGALEGRVLSTDRFGNLVTNIDRERYDDYLRSNPSADVVVQVEGEEIVGISRSYEAVEVGSPLALFGSRHCLEISLNQGDASAYFKSPIGRTVKIRLRKD
jgi:S-adenosylmethionine hydrolase